MLKRLKAACRTNEPQATTVAMLSFMTVMAVGLRENPAPIEAYVLGFFLWPTIAFVANFINPIP